MTLRFKLLWFFIALGFGLLINEVNLHYVKANNPENAERNTKSTVYGYTIWSIDNSWYLPQIKNLVAGQGYTSDLDNPEMRVRRTPGYPLFYGLHYLIFGEKYSFLAIRYTQSILKALSVILLGSAVVFFTGNIKLAKTATIMFAFCPFTAVYTYYTLTESLYPFIFILSVYLFSKALARNKKVFFVFAGITLACLALVRPTAGMLLPVLLLALLVEGWSSRGSIRFALTNGALVIVGFVAAMSPWIVRNYIVTNGELVPLEKYYNESSMDYGKGHTYFARWWSCWDNPAAEIYSNGVLDTIAGPTPEKHFEKADEFLDSLPEYAYSGSSREEVRNSLISLNLCFENRLLAQKATASEHHNLWVSPHPGCEEEVKSKFLGLTNNFKAAAPFRYYVITPLVITKDTVFHSFSSAYGSLNPEDHHPGSKQSFIKGLMYALNSLLFISFLLIGFTKKLNPGFKLLLVLFPLVTILFFAYINRYVETRYILAAYPFFYIALAYFGLEIATITSPLLRALFRQEVNGMIAEESLRASGD